MDKLREAFANIGNQLGRLTVTQRLLIASLVLIMIMGMFLVSQYAGSQTMVTLIPSGTPDDQQKAAAFLADRNIQYKVDAEGKVTVTPDRKYVALAQMAKAQALPGNKLIGFETLVSGSNWMEPLADKQQKAIIALQNELARVIRGFPGVEDASVFISNPERRGLGQAATKPVAQVTIFPTKGSGMEQGTVNALADLVSGSVSGLDVRDVAIIDGVNRRSFRAASQDDLMSGTYIEQVAKVERRIQDKLETHLRFIGDAIVSVNAIVDSAKRESVTTKVLNRGDGTVVVPVEENTTNQASNNTSRAPAEPGVGANIQMDVTRASGGNSGTSQTDETANVKSEVRFGESVVKQRESGGKPTKINVTVSVPRDYVAQVIRTKKGSGAAQAPAGGAATTEPTDAEITQEWTALRTELERMISPLIETDAMVMATTGTASQVVAGSVSAFLIPISMSALGPAGSGSGAGGRTSSGSGGLGQIASYLEGGMVRTIALGLLALVALGMMFSMVRKASSTPTLPTAEELVGIPPALQPGSDVVGEADETESPMTAIEVDEQALKTSKMLAEIGDLVGKNPNNAAAVFNRWLSTEE